MMLLIFLVVLFGSTLGQNPLDCFVGYQYNNSRVIGGPVECDGGICAKASTILSGTNINLYFCEASNVCTPGTTQIFNGLINMTCCNDYLNCNYPGVLTTTAPPPHVTPSLCYEGIFVNKNQTFGNRSATICYGDCATISVTFTNSAQFNGTFTVATCDPVSICHSLDLENSCHAMPKGIISGCCCTGNLCLDPANGTQPTPPLPPPNAIKCPAGVQIINKNVTDYQKTAVTTVDCVGSCHDTAYTVGNITYHVYMCDEKGVCDMLNIPMNRCSEGQYINSCCCDSSNCNLGNLTDLIPQDPFPPMRAERCFGGFALGKFSNVPLGKSERCFGDCVTYTLQNTPIGSIKIFGCDPVSICQKFNAEQGPVMDDDGLQIACCTTRDCNQPFALATNNISCITGVSINYGNSVLNKGISAPCQGQCANYSATVGSISVDVFTCDTYNFCQLPVTHVTVINSHCCNSTDCNGDVTDFPPINTTGKPVIECFMGLELNRVGAIGYHVSCAGHCSRVHLGDSTFFLCDVADVCSSYGVDGCYILADGLSVCCCNGDRCNDKDQRIRPHVTRDLTCLIGYSIGDNFTRGGIMPCNGMCGRFETSLATNLAAVAYVCLDYDLCMGMNLYEECRNLRFDQAIRGCCCGGKAKCNYWGDESVTFPTPAPSTRSITCPEGVWINDKSDYDSYHVTSCQGNCGSVTFNTTFHGQPTKMTYFGCDPASFCKNANLVEGCGSLGGAMTGCCCSTPMCMDPLSGVFQPSSLPPPPMCFVGYSFNSQNLTGGSVPCSGSCMRATGNISSSVTMNLFACEPLGICGLLNSVTNVFDINCCESDNCNAAGYSMPPPAPTSPVDPILCYEGIVFAGTPIANKTTPSLCYGQCAKISAVIGGSAIDAYTCDPVSLCDSLGLQNSCHPGFGNGAFTGCCCNTNNCIAPGKDIPPTTVTTPAPVITTPVPKLKCFVGYQIGSNPLKGGSTPCPGQCMKATKSVSGTTLSIFACEPNSICSSPNIISAQITCCNNGDNCNANGLTLPTTDPTATLPPPILCYEGIYVNGKPFVDDDVDPVRCYGQCASISVKTGPGSSYDVYTCDPASLCSSLQLQNKCLASESGIFTGCCCDSNQCLDPRNNITVPATQKPVLSCFVGYRIGNRNLVGGSTTCPGQCMSASRTYNNTQLTIYACEPASICSAPNNISTVQFSCCKNADNCNAAGLQIPPPPATQAKPIICYEGVFVNGRAQAVGSPSVCNGQCTSISVKTGTDGSSYSVYTCDPGNLCTSLNLTNKCMPSTSGIFTGCCCDSNQCLDPTNGVTVPVTTVTPKPNLNCFIGFQVGNGNLTGGSSTCPGQCMSASKMVNNTKITVFACEPVQICSSPDLIPNIDFSCCGDTDNCNARGLVIPTAPPATPSSKTIVCYEGIYVNGKEYKGGSAQVCNGQCGKVSIKSGNDSAEVYTCDSSSIALCKNLQNPNSCLRSGAFEGCCCDSDLCLNPQKGVDQPGTTQAPPKPTTSNANAAISSIIAFIFVFLLQ